MGQIISLMRNVVFSLYTGYLHISEVTLLIALTKTFFLLQIVQIVKYYIRRRQNVVKIADLHSRNASKASL